MVSISLQSPATSHGAVWGLSRSGLLGMSSCLPLGWAENHTESKTSIEAVFSAQPFLVQTDLGRLMRLPLSSCTINTSGTRRSFTGGAPLLQVRPWSVKNALVRMLGQFQYLHTELTELKPTQFFFFF